jgi:hypothetical protein
VSLGILGAGVAQAWTGFHYPLFRCDPFVNRLGWNGLRFRGQGTNSARYRFRAAPVLLLGDMYTSTLPAGSRTLSPAATWRLLATLSESRAFGGTSLRCLLELLEKVLSVLTFLVGRHDV